MSARRPVGRVRPEHAKLFEEVFRRIGLSILHAETVEPEFLSLVPASRIATEGQLSDFAKKAGEYYAARITENADHGARRALKVAAIQHALDSTNAS